MHPGESKVLSTAPFPQKRSASRPYATLGAKRILTLSEMSESPYKLCLYSTAPFPLAGKKFLSLRSVHYPRSSALHGKGVGGFKHQLRACGNQEMALQLVLMQGGSYTRALHFQAVHKSVQQANISQHFLL